MGMQDGLTEVHPCFGVRGHEFWRFDLLYVLPLIDLSFLIGIIVISVADLKVDLNL